MLVDECSERHGLVLADEGDSAASWLCEGLSARGVPTQLVTSEQLCNGARWTHVINGSGSRFDVRLADGRELTSEQIRFVFNRLTRVPESVLLAAEVADRSYAEQEWRALLASIVRAIPPRVPVWERADPYALGGRWRSPAEWALLADRAGFDVAPWRWHDVLPDWPVADRRPVPILVIGKTTVSEPALSTDVSRACYRLAELARASILQIALVVSDGAPATFCGAEPLADLRVGGDRALDAITLLVA